MIGTSVLMCFTCLTWFRFVKQSYEYKAITTTHYTYGIGLECIMN